MAEPVTLAEIKTYLRIDGGEEDTLLAALIPIAREHCENYLNAGLPAEVPTPMKLALLVLVCHFYEQRAGEEGEARGWIGHGEMACESAAVVAVMEPCVKGSRLPPLLQGRGARRFPVGAAAAANGRAAGDG